MTTGPGGGPWWGGAGPVDAGRAANGERDPYAPPAAHAGPQWPYAPVAGQQPPWHRPPAPPGGPAGWQVVAAAGACVLALVVLLVGVGVARRGGSASTHDQSALAASRARIVHELPRLQAWIAGHRGLRWKAPVAPQVLSDADFVTALGSAGSTGSSIPADDPDDIGTTFAAMGLVKDAASFYAADSSATNGDVVGFYDDVSKRLVVRGTAWTPAMEYTLVHELTHALQDQNFDLSRLEASARNDNETALTTRALIEGDAARVADDYYNTQSTAWRDAVDAAQGSAPAASEPIVDTYAALPYVFGEHFVDELVAVGGNSAVDRAFHAPPTTSQQLLHAAQWSQGSLPAPAQPAFPTKPDGSVADKGALGQLGLWAAVQGRDPRAADAAKLDGWAGDSYVATHGSSGACFVDDLRFRDERTRAAGLAFLKPWIDGEHIRTQDEGDRAVRLSACR